MKVLYIFPHPDDESFGVAHAMHNQRRNGHKVHLLTLTRGGATKQRHKFEYSIDEMGELRFKEMLDVAKVLDLSGMTVLDLPDSGLSEMDPRIIERAVANEIEHIQPAVVVTYAVHGISGFHDHLVTYAVVKRAFVTLQERVSYLKRLALFTITEDVAAKGALFKLNGSKLENIDCIFDVDDVDIAAAHKALDCYVTFKETIDKSGIRDFIGKRVVFEFYREKFDPPVQSLFDRLHT